MRFDTEERDHARGFSVFCRNGWVLLFTNQHFLDDATAQNGCVSDLIEGILLEREDG